MYGSLAPWLLDISLSGKICLFLSDFNVYMYYVNFNVMSHEMYYDKILCIFLLNNLS